MTEEQIASGDSHYEVSLTAGQAFVAFALLLCSLAAAFVFGLMVGKGQSADRLVIRREPPIIEAGEASRAAEAKILDLGVAEVDEPKESTEIVPSPQAEPAIIEESPVAEESAPRPAAAEPSAEVRSEAAPEPARAEVARPAPAPPSVPQPKPVEAASQPIYAQVFSSNDRNAAELLAARLIDNGFLGAYVDRTPSGSAAAFRVRVKFSTEAQARGAADRLRALTRTEPWITRQ